MKGTVYPQSMGKGVLVAVAKYYRNTCYDPDLHGEYVVPYQESNSIRPSGCAAGDTVTHGYSLNEERSVSSILEINSLSNINSEEIVFDFTDEPIPVNATNLKIQVVFRGELGAEQDAVVAAVKDISEPTYFTQVNVSDYYLLNGNYYKGGDILNSSSLSQELQDTCLVSSVTDEVAPAEVTGIQYAFNGYPLVSLGSLSVKKYLRFATLSDPNNNYSLAVDTTFDGVSHHSDALIKGIVQEITVNERDIGGGVMEEYVSKIHLDTMYILRDLPYHVSGYHYKYCGETDWAPPFEIMENLTPQELDAGREPAVETYAGPGGESNKTGRIWPQ